MPLLTSPKADSTPISAATLLFRTGRHSFFVYGFAKSERANISAKELKALKKLADEMLGYTASQILAACKAGELIEVVEADEDEENTQA